MGPRAGQDAAEKRNISVPYREFRHIHQALKLLAIPSELHQLTGYHVNKDQTKNERTKKMAKNNK
jgi:hypothetical protein